MTINTFIHFHASSSSLETRVGSSSRSRVNSKFRYLCCYYHDMRKNDRNHRASVVERANKDRAQASGRVAGSKNLQQPSPSAIHKRRPHVGATDLSRWMGTAAVCLYS